MSTSACGLYFYGTFIALDILLNVYKYFIYNTSKSKKEINTMIMSQLSGNHCYKRVFTKGNNSVIKGPQPLILVHDTPSLGHEHVYQIPSSYLTYEESYAPDKFF